MQITCDKFFYDMYRVIFLTGPAQKSSKYGTGPTQQQKMTKYTGPTQDTEDD